MLLSYPHENHSLTSSILCSTRIVVKATILVTVAVPILALTLIVIPVVDMLGE